MHRNVLGAALASALAMFACAEKESADPHIVVPAPLASTGLDMPASMTAMLASRPAMRTALVKYPRAARWIADRMAGTTGPGPVFWEAAHPASGQSGEFLLDHGRIVLRVADQSTGFDQLGIAVFELINAEGDATFQAYWQRANDGTIERGDFAEAMTRREHQTLVRFKFVSQQLGLVPSAEDLGVIRILEAPEDFDAFEDKIAEYNRTDGGPGYDPRRYWERAYDELQVARE